MLNHVGLYIAGISLFVIATLVFHLLPRTVAAVSIYTVVFYGADLDTTLRVISTEAGRSGIDGIVLFLTGVLFCWFIPGIVLDLSEFSNRWTKLRIRSNP